MTTSIEHRLDALGREAVSDALCSPPGAFLTAVAERHAARQAVRVTFALGAAASFVLAGVTAYLLLPSFNRATSGGPAPVAARPVPSPDADSQPSIINLTATLSADPGAPLPPVGSFGVDPSAVARAGDGAESPVTRDLKQSPPPP